MIQAPSSAPQGQQTDRPIAAVPADEVAVWWARSATLIGFVLAVVAVKLGLAAATDFVRDEAYYSLWALHPLQAGYYDHPAAVAWFIKTGYWLLGPSAFAARVLAVLSIVPISAAIHRIAMIGFADRRIAALSVYFFILTPGAIVGLLVITPDAPSMLFWTLALWAAAELIRSQKGYWWLVFGLFAGLGLDSKYTGLFLGAGIVLWLIADGAARRWWRSPWLYAAGALAAALFAPVIIWNAGHGQSSFAFQFGRSVEGFNALGWRDLTYTPEFIASQVALVLPGLFLLGCAAAVLYIARRPLRQNAVMGLLVLTALPAIGYFLFHTLHSAAQGNWPWPLYAQWAIAGAWAAVAWRPRTAIIGAIQRLTLRWQAPMGALVFGILCVQALYQPIMLPFTDQTREMAGWHQAVDAIAKVSADTGNNTILAPDYGMYGRLASYKAFDGHAYRPLPLDDFHRYGFINLPANDDAVRWPVLIAVPAKVLPQGQTPANLPARLRRFRPAPKFIKQIVRFGADGTPASAIDLYRLDRPQPPVFGP